MSDITTEKLREDIAEILKGANLAQTSAKKVRLQLETKLGVQLTSRRKEIDQLVMDYVNNQPGESEEDNSEEEEESESEEEKKEKKEEKKKASKREVKKRKAKEESEEEEEEEEKPKKAPPKKKGRKKKKGSDSDSDVDWDKKQKKGGGRKGSGYTREYRLSPALAELMGQDSMARHQVVKRVWAIVKERQLFDANNRQFAICDDQLYKVFGTKRFRTFGMMKYLKTHFYD